MAEPKVRVEPGQHIEPLLLDGADLVLAPGIHVGCIVVEHNVSISGEPGAILDADRRGPTLAIAEDGLQIRISGVTIRGGAGEAGGGLRLTGRSEITLTNCTFDDNEATLGGSGVGGGVWCGRGKVALVDCRFTQNRARNGNDLYLTNVGWVTVSGGSFAGDIFVGEGARFDATATRIHGRLSSRGTTTRAPMISLRGTQVSGGIDNDANLPASYVVEDG